MIKVRGWQVSPAELESVLMLHSDILDCAVIGITIANGTDEVPRAYIVKKPGSQLNATVVKTFMSAYLAKYKSLDGGIVFTDSIAKNSTGKVLRKVLKERAEREAKKDFKKAFVKNVIFSALSIFRQPKAITVEDVRGGNVSRIEHVNIDTIQPVTSAPASLGWKEANCDWTSNPIWKLDCQNFVDSNHFPSEVLCTLPSKGDLTDQYLVRQEEKARRPNSDASPVNSRHYLVEKPSPKPMNVRQACPFTGRRKQEKAAAEVKVVF